MTISQTSAYRFRDSGITWLGEVPEHWSIAKLGYRYRVELGKMLDSRKVSGEFLRPYLRNVDVQWDTINEEELPLMDFYPRELSRYSVMQGDLLVCEGGEIGRAAIWMKPYRCCYQKALHRLRAIDPLHDAPRFMFYSLAVAVSQGRFTASGEQATIAHLPAESFRRIRFSIPPYREQTQIAKFLDYETARIDALIEKQEQLISLLKEKRQAVISHAVTKGLNPDAPMRDSGVEWLGEVPAHWDVGVLKRFISTRKGAPFKQPDFCDTGVPVVRASDIKNRSIRQPSVFLPCSFLESHSRAVLKAGELILSTVGSGVQVVNSAVGQVGQLPSSLDGALLNQNTVVFSIEDERLSSQYLLQLVQSNGYRSHLDLYAHGTANQASLNVVDMLAFHVPLPPDTEQAKIVEHLEQTRLQMDGIEGLASEQVALLQERRTALISAAVTGKIDVRGWQAPATQSEAELA